jgi:ornithine carbamoyltransferase
MVQGIMIRTFAHEIVQDMAHYGSIPVINGLTDFSHPCQAMADYMTMWEIKGRVHGLKVAFVGDGNNVAHSVMFTGAQLGAHVCVATPSGYEPKPHAVAWAKQRARETGGTCHVTNDAEEAVCGADVVYTDVWASMGQESQAAERREVFAGFQVSASLFALAKRDAIFMHCLPAHRGEEITDDVIDGPRSVVLDQAENRLHAQKAVMVWLIRPEILQTARSPE